MLLVLRGKRLTVENSVEVTVQVDWKTGSKVSVPRDAEQKAVVAAAQEDPAVRRFTKGKGREDGVRA
jgi:hypothetical protein